MDRLRDDRNRDDRNRDDRNRDDRNRDDRNRDDRLRDDRLRNNRISRALRTKCHHSTHHKTLGFDEPFPEVAISNVIEKEKTEEEETNYYIASVASVGFCPVYEKGQVAKTYAHVMRIKGYATKYSELIDEAGKAFYGTLWPEQKHRTLLLSKGYVVIKVEDSHVIAISYRKLNKEQIIEEMNSGD